MTSNRNSYTDPYHKALHYVMHESMDRLIQAGATIEAHGDILSTEDEYDEEGFPDQALRLFKAQMQVKGGEQDIQHYQALLMHTSNLLILAKSRSLVIDNTTTAILDDIHSSSTTSVDSPAAPTAVGAGSKARGTRKAKGEDKGG